MNKFDLVFMSVRSLWRRKFRSALTVLGVVIGTTSIVLMISLALAMNQNYENQINEWGALTLITVTPEDSMDSLVEVEDLDESAIEIFERLPNIEKVMPYISTTMNVSVGDYNSMREVTIIGLDTEELEALDYTPSEGRLYETSEQSVAIVGGNFTSQLAKKGQQLGSKTSNSKNSNSNSNNNNFANGGNRGNMSFPSGMGGTPGSNMGGAGGMNMPNGNMIPEGMPGGMMPNDMSDDQTQDNASIDVFNSVVKLTYQTFSFRTFGDNFPGISTANTSTIATPKATSIQIVGMLESGNEDTDNYIFMPREDVLNLIRQKAIYEAQLNNTSPETTIDTYDKVTVKVSSSDNVETVRNYIESLGFTTTTAQDTLDQMKSMSSSIQLILMGIGAISLIVSAIGITNTMMMSISERTKEIGVMKVIGAVISDIKQMFLVEASIIGLVGGIIGIGICYLISWLLNNYAVGLFGDLVGASSGSYETYVSLIPSYLAGGAILFAAIVGLVAGYMPAKRATTLSALTALKSE
ncbi:ABC transporter permease [Cellulosilyticum sp. ST5]|uniref:ABC transporter permease n=1 Tax=Cellulosilyticum sp. ST5 TaxID=3055805 RepID=UPI0039774C8D